MIKGRIEKALSGFYYVNTGTETLQCRARGRFRREGLSPLVGDWVQVRELGGELLPRLFEKNPYMNEIYPDAASRSALTVFVIYEGSGEWFDLSRNPIERASFTFGGAEEVQEGYFVSDACIGCKLCYSKCPQKCIDISGKPVVIQQQNCLHCGNCYEICPARAIVKRG